MATSARRRGGRDERGRGRQQQQPAGQMGHVPDDAPVGRSRRRGQVERPVQPVERRLVGRPAEEDGDVFDVGHVNHCPAATAGQVVVSPAGAGQ